MIRKWLLAAMACGSLVFGLIGCGEAEPEKPPKPPKPPVKGTAAPAKKGTAAPAEKTPQEEPETKPGSVKK